MANALSQQFVSLYVGRLGGVGPHLDAGEHAASVHTQKRWRMDQQVKLMSYI